MSDLIKHTSRSFVVSFRLTAEEAARIDAAALKLKSPRSRSDYCRAASLYTSRQQVPDAVKRLRRPARRLPALDTQVLSKILGQIGKIGSNVNQLARSANSTPTNPSVKVLVSISSEITLIKQALLTTLHGSDGVPHDH